MPTSTSKPSQQTEPSQPSPPLPTRRCRAVGCDTEIGVHETVCRGCWTAIPGDLKIRINNAVQARDVPGWRQAMQDAIAHLARLRGDVTPTRWVLISGRTFAYSQQIREAGGVWVEEARAWAVPESKGRYVLGIIGGGRFKVMQEGWKPV